MVLLGSDGGGIAMQAGVVTEENFAQILRGISQKRRHGVLEMHSGDAVVEISFYQGKIVDLTANKRKLLDLVVQKLKVRGTVSIGFERSDFNNAEEVLQALADAGEDVAPELLALVSQQVALEALYSLELGAGSYYHFRVEMVPTPDATLGLQISIGQLLLDMVSLKEAAAADGADLPADMIISRGVREDREYSLEENDLIWLVDGEMPISELRIRSLLNRLAFDETLRGLLAAGVLRRDGDSSCSESLFNLDSLDASIDQLMNEVTSASARHSEDGPLVLGQDNSNSVSIDKLAIESVSNFGERLSLQLLESRRVPDIALGVFLIATIVFPWLLW